MITCYYKSYILNFSAWVMLFLDFLGLQFRVFILWKLLKCLVGTKRLIGNSPAPGATLFWGWNCRHGAGQGVIMKEQVLGQGSRVR